MKLHTFANGDFPKWNWSLNHTVRSYGKTLLNGLKTLSKVITFVHNTVWKTTINAILSFKIGCTHLSQPQKVTCLPSSPFLNHRHFSQNYYCNLTPIKNILLKITVIMLHRHM